jgi:hypothetical protein
MVGVVKHFVGRWEERVLAADQVTQLERVEDRSSNSAAACPALSNSCATVIFLIRFSSDREGLSGTRLVQIPDTHRDLVRHDERQWLRRGARESAAS